MPHFHVCGEREHRESVRGLSLPSRSPPTSPRPPQCLPSLKNGPVERCRCSSIRELTAFERYLPPPRKTLGGCFASLPHSPDCAHGGKLGLVSAPGAEFEGSSEARSPRISFPRLHTPAAGVLPKLYRSRRTSHNVASSLPARQQQRQRQQRIGWRTVHRPSPASHISSDTHRCPPSTRLHMIAIAVESGRRPAPLVPSAQGHEMKQDAAHVGQSTLSSTSASRESPARRLICTGHKLSQNVSSASTFPATAPPHLTPASACPRPRPKLGQTHLQKHRCPCRDCLGGLPPRLCRTLRSASTTIILNVRQLL